MHAKGSRKKRVADHGLQRKKKKKKRKNGSPRSVYVIYIYIYWFFCLKKKRIIILKRNMCVTQHQTRQKKIGMQLYRRRKY